MAITHPVDSSHRHHAASQKGLQKRMCKEEVYLEHLEARVQATWVPAVWWAGKT